MGSVSVVGLGPQTGVRPREDDRHLCSGQIRLDQIRTEQEDARQEEPKAPNGKRNHPDRGGCEVPGSGHRQRLLWVEYARYVPGKVMAAAHKVRGVAGRAWGTDPRTLREIYDGAIRPLLLYGAGVWGERSEDTRIQKRLRAAQRSFLLGITKAYRTSSNVAGGLRPATHRGSSHPLNVGGHRSHQDQTRRDR
jgi:hypothetical protein